MVFHHESIRRNTRFHRKAFRAITLLVCFRGLSWSRICPILWHTPLPLHAFALLHWRLWRSQDCTISSKYPFQHHSSHFCWSCALTLRSRQQSLVPQVQELMQASTYFPKVRRMLLFHAPLISTHFGHLPRCFAGTLLLPLCLFLRPILKFWSVGATPMRFTWAKYNRAKDFGLEFWYDVQ